METSPGAESEQCLWLVKATGAAADDFAMSPDELLPTKAGPVPDRLTIWPVDDGRYGLDATFHGGSGYERAQIHIGSLEKERVPHTFRQEPEGAWTLRFGPLPAASIATALSAFVY